jgi:hypothetical protein
MLISNLGDHRLQEREGLSGLRLIFFSNNGWGMFIEDLSSVSNKVRQPFLQKKNESGPQKTFTLPKSIQVKVSNEHLTSAVT